MDGRPNRRNKAAFSNFSAKITKTKEICSKDSIQGDPL